MWQVMSTPSHILKVTSGPSTVNWPRLEVQWPLWNSQPSCMTSASSTFCQRSTGTSNSVLPLRPVVPVCCLMPWPSTVKVHLFMGLYQSRGDLYSCLTTVSDVVGCSCLGGLGPWAWAGANAEAVTASASPPAMAVREIHWMTLRLRVVIFGSMRRLAHEHPSHSTEFLGQKRTFSVPLSGAFVGRGEETAQIRLAAESVQRGALQFVVVEGLAHTGKTALISHALEPFGWQTVGVTLDEAGRTAPGTAVRRILGTTAPAVDNVEETLRFAAEQARKLTEPAILTISNLHEIDEASAESLTRGLTFLENMPVLVIMTTRPTQRPVVQRLVQLADSSPQGTLIRLSPLGMEDVQEILSRTTGLPVGMAVTRRVMEETDGLPLYVLKAARWLRERLPGTRGIERALQEAVLSVDHGPLRSETLCLASAFGESTTLALKTLALAEAPLTKRQLDQLTGTDVDIQSLLATTLVRWDEISFGYRLTYSTIRRALASGLTHGELIELHTQLADMLQGTPSTAHCVALLRLDPEAGDAHELHATLLEKARELQRGGEITSAFRVSRLACLLRPTEEALVLLSDLAVTDRCLYALTAFEPVIWNLPPSAIRSAMLALIALERNDVDHALKELDQSHELPQDYVRLLIFARALADVTGLFMARGDLGAGRGMDLHRRVLDALDQLEGRLEEKQQIGHVLGMKALLRICLRINEEQEEDYSHLLPEGAGFLEHLEAYPTADFARLAILSLRGTYYRQIGEFEKAYQDFSYVTSFPLKDGYVVHAHTQLAMLLFSAGLWEEAEETAARAAEAQLLQNENTNSLLLYTTAALLPSGRTGENAEFLMEQLESVRRQAGPVFQTILEWAHALRAAAQGDHEGVARHVMNMRNSSAGLTVAAVDLLMVLAKALHFCGWSGMLPPLLRSLKQDIRMESKQGRIVIAYVEGVERWSAGAPEDAVQLLDQALRGLDQEPRIRPTQPAGEGGGLRLARAMVAVDFAALVAGHPETLGSYRGDASELAAWGASVYRGCGVQAQVDFAEHLLATLSEDLATPISQPPAAEEEASSPEPPAEKLELSELLELLSRREQEIALMVRRKLTNKEIAEELTLSVRTVEYHVSNILGKVGASSRWELRQLLLSA